MDYQGIEELLVLPEFCVTGQIINMPHDVVFHPECRDPTLLYPLCHTSSYQLPRDYLEILSLI